MLSSDHKQMAGVNAPKSNAREFWTSDGKKLRIWRLREGAPFRMFDRSLRSKLLLTIRGRQRQSLMNLGQRGGASELRMHPKLPKYNVDLKYLSLLIKQMCNKYVVLQEQLLLAQRI